MLRPQSAPSSALLIHCVLTVVDEAPIALRVADGQEELVATRAGACRAAEARILELEGENPTPQG